MAWLPSGVVPLLPPSGPCCQFHGIFPLLCEFLVTRDLLVFVSDLGLFPQWLGVFFLTWPFSCVLVLMVLLNASIFFPCILFLSVPFYLPLVLIQKVLNLISHPSGFNLPKEVLVLFVLPPPRSFPPALSILALLAAYLYMGTPILYTSPNGREGRFKKFHETSPLSLLCLFPFLPKLLQQWPFFSPFFRFSPSFLKAFPGIIIKLAPFFPPVLESLINQPQAMFFFFTLFSQFLILCPVSFPELRLVFVGGWFPPPPPLLLLCSFFFLLVVPRSLFRNSFLVVWSVLFLGPPCGISGDCSFS